MKREFYSETEKTFTIVCKKCNRKNVNFEFTDDNNIVIHCKACGRTQMVWRN